MKFIGSKLKHLREIKNMSMTELTELTGIKQGYISEIETGKKNPGPAIVEKISTALKIDQLYFYLEESRLPIDVMPDMPPELQNYYKAIESGADTKYIIEPLNVVGKLKQELEDRLNKIKHPFEDISKKEILDYLKTQKGIKIPRDNIEVCKKIVTDHVESVTIYDKSHIEIVLKYHFPVVPESGGGGGTPHKVLLFKVSA